jgi:hypothetical protein
MYDYVKGRLEVWANVKTEAGIMIANELRLIMWGLKKGW